MSAGLLWWWLFFTRAIIMALQTCLCLHIWLLNWATVYGGEGLTEEEEEEEGGEGGGAARAAWGLLGPTEGIVICNIHSNVPYQMQWVWRCSGMEISLVPHSALVTPRANQTNEFTQTIHMERRQYRGMYEWQKRRRGVKHRRSMPHFLFSP